MGDCTTLPRVLEIVSAKLLHKSGRLYYEGDPEKPAFEVLDCAVRDDGSTPRLYILLKDSKGERYIILAYLSYDGARNATFAARVGEQISIKDGKIKGELEPLDLDQFASSLVDRFEGLDDLVEPPEE